MKSCILPFTTDVEILAYQNKAFPLGVIKANVIDYDIWLCNKLINCILKIDGEYNSYDKDLWSLNDGVTTEQLMQFHPTTYANKGLNLILFNKEMIKSGSYICGQYNEFYIKGKRSYQRKDYDHDYLIFGYDDELGAFKSVGYLPKKGYTFFDIAYEDYYNSIVGNTRDPLCINYYEINKDYLPQINIDKIKVELENYISSRYDNEGTKTRATFGMIVWDKFVEYIVSIGADKLDYRYCRLCLEHRGIMLKRLHKLLELNFLRNKDLVEAYDRNIYLKMQNVYYLFIKYNLTKSKKVHHSIIEILRQTNKQESEIIKKVLADLNEERK